MVGLGGRSLFLTSTSLSQYNKKCSTVSYGCIQCLHIGANSGSILFLWKFRLMCPVLNRKMLHWSLLAKLLMGSLGLGVGKCEQGCSYHLADLGQNDSCGPPVASGHVHTYALPFPLHLLCQTSLVFCFAICFAVSYVVLTFSCGICDPILANPSALSFRRMSQWAGIHCIVTWIL